MSPQFSQVERQADRHITDKREGGKGRGSDGDTDKRVQLQRALVKSLMVTTVTNCWEKKKTEKEKEQ